MVEEPSDAQFATAVTELTQVATAAFQWHKQSTEEVSVSAPLSLSQRLWLKKAPRPFSVQGVHFAEKRKDIEGFIFEQADGQLMIAARIFLRLGFRRYRAGYWTYTIEEYVVRVADYEKYFASSSPKETPQQRIQYAHDKLDQLVREATGRVVSRRQL